MAQHAILRFEKTQGKSILETAAIHHEQQKRQYASVPTLTQAGVNTASISSGQAAITISFRPH